MSPPPPIGPFLADLLRRGQAEQPWYGPSTQELLSDLGASEAARRPVANAHTIWEIVLHMTAWLGEVARRLEGHSPQLPLEGDWPAMPVASEAAWLAAKASLAEAVERVATLVSGLSPEALERPIGTSQEPALETGVTAAQTVAGVLEHNAYHAGQIALLAKAVRLG